MMGMRKDGGGGLILCYIARVSYQDSTACGKGGFLNGSYYSSSSGSGSINDTKTFNEFLRSE